MYVWLIDRFVSWPHQLHPSHLYTKLDFVVLVTDRPVSILLLGA